MAPVADGEFVYPRGLMTKGDVQKPGNIAAAAACEGMRDKAFVKGDASVTTGVCRDDAYDDGPRLGLDGIPVIGGGLLLILFCFLKLLLLLLPLMLLLLSLLLLLSFPERTKFMGTLLSDADPDEAGDEVTERLEAGDGDRDMDRPSDDSFMRFELPELTPPSDSSLSEQTDSLSMSLVKRLPHIPSPDT